MTNYILPSIRLIARLDVKGPNLIKSINLEGIRVIGNPHQRAIRYYEQGADELIFIDAVASLYGRNNLHEVVTATAKDIFIPITVGGGVRSVADAEKLLHAGADKIAINTEATKRPELITEIADRFGSQCVVLSIEAKEVTGGKWEAYVDCGRERSGLDAVEWAVKGVELGAGEILVTSIDREGTRKGFDVELTRKISEAVSVPVIASGGYGRMEHLQEVVVGGRASAAAIADALHYDRTTMKEIHQGARQFNLPVRKLP